MDIKAKIEELAQRIRSDEALQAQFRTDPITAVEQLLGIDLPNEQIQAIVDGVKAKIKLDQLGSALSGLGGLFGK
jgi:hypothetical protein